MKRQDHKPKLNENLWTSRDGAYYTTADKIDEILRISGYSEDELRRRLGHGYDMLGKIRTNHGVDYWCAKHIEWGISPENKNIPKMLTNP